jgi:FKBP-type peptidyl-prolyl cis-trans isomerase 2
VRIHYVLESTDGEVKIDSRAANQTIEFLVGSSHILRPVERSLVGMAAGETRETVVEPKEGYGDYADSMKATVPRSELPEGAQVELDQVVMTGNGAAVRVTDVSDESVTFDGNHPLAGKTLKYEVSVVQHTPEDDVLEPERLVRPRGASEGFSDAKAGDDTTFPRMGDRVKVHYTGRLEGGDRHGEVFDCSRERAPIAFEVGVGQVVRGWDEGILQLSLGQRAELLIPPSKGYGDQGAGDTIPGGSWLRFDVELVDIDAAPLNTIKLPPHQRMQAAQQMAAERAARAEAAAGADGGEKPSS